MKRGGKYLRISDDREGRELGVGRQSEDCDTLASREGVTVVAEYVDNDVSASVKARKERPAYQRMLADARAGKLDVIVAYTSGRLTRRPREHEDLIDLAVSYGITYRYVRSPSFDLNTAAGRRVARILAANDAGESEDISERVAREVRQRAAKGEYHGGPRGYGYTPGGREVVESEAAEIRRWYEHVLAGGSLSSIRADLVRRGVESATGVPWRTPVIRKILMNPRNIGIRVLDGKEHPAPYPPIVSAETYRAVRAVLEHPDRGNGNPTGTARKHLGTGLYRCERCQVTVNASHDKGRVYRCLTCWRSWRADPIDRWVLDLVAGILAKEDARERLLPAPTRDVDTRALAAEAAAVRQNMAELAKGYATATGATRDALRAGLEAGEGRLGEIEQLLDSARTGGPLSALALAADPVRVWRDLEDVVQRQRVVTALMTIDLGAPIRGRARWDAAKFITVTPRRGGGT